MVAELQGFALCGGRCGGAVSALRPFRGVERRGGESRARSADATFHQRLIRGSFLPLNSTFYKGA